MNSRDNQYDEERIGKLLGALPPAPEGWVTAAQELPRARKEMDDIVARAEADAEFRAAVLADLEAALEAAGYDIAPRHLPALRERLEA
jgi:regulator of protease activity HflC (stomatin/prohibitin superfamily)